MRRRILYGIGAAAVGLLLLFGLTGGVLMLLALGTLPALVLFGIAVVRPAFFKRHRFAAGYAGVSAIVAVGAVGWIIGWFASASPAPLYLLPVGYTGPAVVVYDQPDGVPEWFEDGRRVYAIPDSGVLRTQSAPDDGLHSGQSAFAYVDDRGRRRPLPYVDWPHKPRPAGPDTFVSGLSGASARRLVECPSAPTTSSTVRYTLFGVSPHDDSTGQRLMAMTGALTACPAAKR